MSSTPPQKPHAVCVPFPAQGHINGMLKLAMVLHSKGFHITFVNTEHNHRRILNSSGTAALSGLPSFQFVTIDDGLPPINPDASQNLESLVKAIRNDCFTPFRELVGKLNAPLSQAPPVTCIVSDTFASFTLEITGELGIPNVMFCSASACGYMCVLYYDELVRRGIVPFKVDQSCPKNELEFGKNWALQNCWDLVKEWSSIADDYPTGMSYGTKKKKGKEAMSNEPIVDLCEDNVTSPKAGVHNARPIGNKQALKLKRQKTSGVLTVDEEMKGILSRMEELDKHSMEMMARKKEAHEEWIKAAKAHQLYFSQLMEFDAEARDDEILAMSFDGLDEQAKANLLARKQAINEKLRGMTEENMSDII